LQKSIIDNPSGQTTAIFIIDFYVLAVDNRRHCHSQSIILRNQGL
jgi:hypothetical protein